MVHFAYPPLTFKNLGATHRFQPEVIFTLGSKNRSKIQAKMKLPRQV